MLAATIPVQPPGGWRRIVLKSRAGLIDVALEDDAHRFSLRMSYEARTITALVARTDRAPWSTCDEAGSHLAAQLIGRRLDAVAMLEAGSHCTHLLDLAILAATHRGRDGRLCYDLRVADRVGTLTTATLVEDGDPCLRWRLDGTVLTGPDAWAGRDLKRFAVWKDALSPSAALRASLLRRAVLVSGVRQQPDVLAVRAADRTMRIGACFTYQLPRAERAVPATDWRRDFAGGGRLPLDDLVFATHDRGGAAE